MRRYPAFVLFAAATLGGCIGVPPDAERVQTGPPDQLQIELAAGDALALSVPAGDVVIRGVDGNVAAATMTIECPRDSSRCMKWAESVELESRREDGRVIVRVNKGVKLNASLKLVVDVPKRHALDVAMDYGALAVTDTAHDLTVVLKAGDVQIDTDAYHVASVDLQARFGDSSLRVGSRGVDGSRPWLTGAKVQWDGGAGSRRIVGRVRYGNLSVTLR